MSERCGGCAGVPGMGGDAQMILVEGAVCAAMKRDVKAGGYLAFGLAREDERWLGLKGNGWIALAEMGNVPRKVLGTLVEHAGGIPALGQSWTMQKPRKGDIQRQDTMFGMIEEEVRGLLDGDWSNARQLGRMPLTLDGMGLWQDRQDLSIRRVAPELEDLAEWNGKAYGSGAYLVKSGLFSWCFVLRQPEDGGHDVWLRHLEKMSWVG